MNNFCSITFGVQLGVAIYSPSCELIFSSCMRYCSPDEFRDRLKAMREHHKIDLAIVQAFGDILDYPSQHLEQIKEVFPEHILVHRDQWNPSRMGYESLHALAEAHHGRKLNRPEQVDAILMGRWLYLILSDAGIPFPAEHLGELARTTRRFPRRQDLRAIRWRNHRTAVSV
ncbi:MAG TPA: hypothetical protein PKZ83_16800 [bacterium]|nr:hypothetical protein [bacterium]HQJ66291.1 hypothetical protein [bacterium]